MAARKADAQAAESGKEAKENETPVTVAKRGRSKKALAEQQAAAPDGETPPKAKRGRPSKAEAGAAKEKGKAGAKAEQPAAATNGETSPKAAKRGRSSKSVEADADKAEKDATSPAATGKREKSPKKQKQAAAPKRDKNSPLPRSLTPRELDPADGNRVLRVLSLNVAGLRSVLNGDKAKVLRELIEREKPDVLCLNEHKLKEEDVEENEAKLKELLPKEYATMHWTCSTAKKGYSGVAVILRHAGSGDGDDDAGRAPALAAPEALNVTPGMGALADGDPIAGEEGRLLTLELPELFIVAAYVPNSGMDLGRLSYRVDRDAKHCWDRALGEYVKGLQKDKGKAVVLIGDMNCCHRVQDIWNMHDRPDFPEGLAQKPVEEQYLGLTSLKKQAGLTPDERNSFPKLLEDADLVDTFRALHPDASGVFSYFSQRMVQNRPMNKGLRLDYVLASSSLCGHLKPKDSREAVTADTASGCQLQLPRVHDSFILDQYDLVADHAAIGCHILLPSL